MELLKIFGLAVAETVETSEAGKYRLPQIFHFLDKFFLQTFLLYNWILR